MTPLLSTLNPSQLEDFVVFGLRIRALRSALAIAPKDLGSEERKKVTQHFAEGDEQIYSVVARELERESREDYLRAGWEGLYAHREMERRVG